MRNLSLIVFAIVLCMVIILFVPKYALELIGCWQIGSWVGSFIQNNLEK
jgi:Na+-transporting methylmalonyl-CoA/oxaloacetate decarboxylase beta subunit